MLRGLWKLTWLEIKIFLREPLGAFGSIVLPVLVFVLMGRFMSGRLPPSGMAAAQFVRVELPVLVAVLIALSGVVSLVTIISIYREGGILKRLRATPLRPQTILTAHVLVKLTLTTLTMALTALAGKRYYPALTHFPVFGFTIALLISTWSILSIGFQRRCSAGNSADSRVKSRSGSWAMRCRLHGSNMSGRFSFAGVRPLLRHQ
jgi:ABC-2 type transport system permease protein